MYISLHVIMYIYVLTTKGPQTRIESCVCGSKEVVEINSKNMGCIHIINPNELANIACVCVCDCERIDDCIYGVYRRLYIYVCIYLSAYLISQSHRHTATHTDTIIRCKCATFCVCLDVYKSVQTIYINLCCPTPLPRVGPNFLIHTPISMYHCTHALRSYVVFTHTAYIHTHTYTHAYTAYIHCIHT